MDAILPKGGDFLLWQGAREFDKGASSAIMQFALFYTQSVCQNDEMFEHFNAE